MITYERDGCLLCYSREANMPDALPTDPTMPPDAAPPPPPAPSEDDEREDYYRHCASHPYHRTHHEKMLSYAAAPAPGIGPTNGSNPEPPPEPGPKEPPADYARGEQAAHYARLETELRQLRRDREKDRKDLDRERAARLDAERRAQVIQYERELAQLAADEGIVLDVSAEMVDVAPQSGPVMSREQFDRHKTRIATNYQRGPVGGDLLPVRKDPPAGGGKKELTEARLGEAHQYMLDHNVSMEEAVRHVTGA